MTSRHRRPYTTKDLESLQKFAAAGLTARQIARLLRRTRSSILGTASRAKIRFLGRPPGRPSFTFGSLDPWKPGMRRKLSRSEILLRRRQRYHQRKERQNAYSRDCTQPSEAAV